MWQTSSSVLIVIMARVTGLGQAVSQTAGSAPSAQNNLIVSLLEESHELDQQVPLMMRLQLLDRQAAFISRIPGDPSSELGRQWADELFALAAQAKSPIRSYLQSSALRVLARLQPNAKMSQAAFEGLC